MAGFSVMLDVVDEAEPVMASVTMSQAEMQQKISLIKSSLGLTSDQAVAQHILQRVIDEINKLPVVT